MGDDGGMVPSVEHTFEALATTIQPYGHMFYHFLIETVPKLAMMRDWLTNTPDAKVRIIITMINAPVTKLKEKTLLCLCLVLRVPVRIPRLTHSMCCCRSFCSCFVYILGYR